MSDAEPAPVYRRPPRPLVVHFLVDTAIAFLLVILIFLMFELPLWAAVLFSVGVGLGACRYTYRAEVDALAKRPEPPSSS